MASKAEKARRQISARVLRNKRGFTYVELSVVLLVLILVASIVVPRMQGFLAGESYRRSVEEMTGVGRLASGLAIAAGQPVSLTYDSASASLLLSNGDEATDSTQRSIEIPEGFEPTRFVAAGGEASPNEWKLTFYADGTCDGGGIEFIERSQAESLRFDATDSRSTLITEPLPQPGEDRWAAGEYEKRE